MKSELGFPRVQRDFNYCNRITVCLRDVSREFFQRPEEKNCPLKICSPKKNLPSYDRSLAQNAKKKIVVVSTKYFKFNFFLYPTFLV